MDEAEEVRRLHLVASADTAEAEQPRKEPLHLPAALVPSKRPSILLPRALANAERCDQLDPLVVERRLELRAVVGSVCDEPLRLRFREAGFEGSVNERNFATLTRSDGGRYRKTIAVCDRHELGGRAATSSSHKKTPFFAPAWVPSMKVSLRSSLPRAIRSSASACRTSCRTPASTQPWKRRKHVAYGGYRAGMSAHGAPVRRIQRTPLRTSLGSRHGRPRPSSRTLGLGSNASTTDHCASVRSIPTLDHRPDRLSIL